MQRDVLFTQPLLLAVNPKDAKNPHQHMSIQHELFLFIIFIIFHDLYVIADFL